jgi:hypothetical protein
MIQLNVELSPILSKLSTQHKSGGLAVVPTEGGDVRNQSLANRHYKRKAQLDINIILTKIIVMSKRSERLILQQVGM